MPRRPTESNEALTAPARGLRYSRDREPGLRRLDTERGVEYFDTDGKRLKDRETLARIRSLAIPPAWTDVWICKDARGHLQATGRDKRGRKQYRYHPAWRATREADKFEHLLEFAGKLPAIRRRVRADLRAKGLPRRKVLAAIVGLLETSCIRVGNERYAEENGSFGLTTLRNRHVRVKGTRIEFEFRGKSGKFHRIAVDDPRLARIVRRCRDLPGQELFQYVDADGSVQSVSSSDVNDYLHGIAGDDVSTKDFRTWAGSLGVAAALARCDDPQSPTRINVAIREAAQRLGNTPAICRKSYVHPLVIDTRTWEKGATRHSIRTPRGLRAEEAALLRILRRGLSTRRAKRHALVEPARHGAMHA
jgi:DNA topoisomerase-1